MTGALEVWLRQQAPIPLARYPPAMAGQLLAFNRIGVRVGRPIYVVISRRGAGELGQIEWSNQWNRAKFTPHPEAVFDTQCLAEIWAACKGLK